MGAATAALACIAAACDCVETSMGTMCVPEACLGPQITVHLDDVPPMGTIVTVETADTVLTQACALGGWCAFSYRFALRPADDVPPGFVPPSSATVSVAGPDGVVVTRTFDLAWGTQHDQPATRADCLAAAVRMEAPAAG